MSIKVLVVDDSSFFRRRVSEIIEQAPELSVIGTAKDGKEAIAQALALKPDVITMDVEMPVLDGISAVREIMAQQPTAILMFSSLTHDGAKATLDALDAGALDFLPKKFEDIARNRNDAVELLQNRIKQLGAHRAYFRRSTPTRTPLKKQASTARVTPSTRGGVSQTTRPSIGGLSSSASRPVVAQRKPVVKKDKKYKIVIIGTSTGGPVALQKILTELPSHFPVPILLIQHMPAAFTPAFANRLNSLCKISVKEAENGDVLRPGTAYLAPGGTQMMIEGRSSSAKLKVMVDESDRLTYKPSVDLTFGSVAKSFGGDVLSMVLTGMGADGREGARLLKDAGATIWAQDEASCVVYGMPQAVTAAGLSEDSIALKDFASRIIAELGL
ncbi:chemotaxis response regulator protein-glutamate methylesterase [Saccharobesus litoralis]|uniref:Protein-glutamate methylesterase/protein-glutamine glutaminase n=1 Tax=Saccharobesus litoralis TaxID=2172099 RepID=A0A2S0VT53_9ALTE|nr:chemotaxis response regulator protein-glutamate methylesterase [Saccharobesus litoralis]AWB67389.1 chemotaxis response regulator protein-glutamate methylesterase [Saccharobesus litoralis]